MNRSVMATSVAFYLSTIAVAAGGGPEGVRVTFNSDDGQTLVAQYYAPRTAASASTSNDPTRGEPIVILLHENRGTRENWNPLIPALHDANFAVLALDLRGHGESADPRTREQVDRRDSSLYAAMDLDVWAAYSWIVEQPGVDRSRVVLVGASVGCSVAMRYAVRDWSVDVIVCLSPGENYLGIDSKSDAKGLTGRKVLYIASEAEKPACDVLQPLTAGCEVRILKQEGHGTELLKSDPELSQSIAKYIRESLGGRSTYPVYCSIKSGNRVYHTQGSGWITRINPRNLRILSSPDEAKARGLRPSRSRSPNDGPEGAVGDGDNERSGPQQKKADAKEPTLKGDKKPRQRP